MLDDEQCVHKCEQMVGSEMAKPTNCVLDFASALKGSISAHIFGDYCADVGIVSHIRPHANRRVHGATAELDRALTVAWVLVQNASSSAK